MSEPRRGEVHLVGLGRTPRPGVIVSPDELNGALGTVLVAPMTTGGRAYAFRIPCRFQKKDGHVVLDQLRTVDEARLVRRLGRLSVPTMTRVLGVLREMFAE